MSEEERRRLLLKTLAGLLAALTGVAEVKELAHVPPKAPKPHVEPPEFGARRTDVGISPVLTIATSPGFPQHIEWLLAQEGKAGQVINLGNGSFVVFG